MTLATHLFGPRNLRYGVKKVSLKCLRMSQRSEIRSEMKYVDIGERLWFEARFLGRKWSLVSRYKMATCILNDISI